jgi:hypothetical protein
MEVKVEHGRAPLVRGRALADDRRNNASGGDGFEEFTAVRHTNMHDSQCVSMIALLHETLAPSTSGSTLPLRTLIAFRMCAVTSSTGRSPLTSRMQSRRA